MSRSSKDVASLFPGAVQASRNPGAGRRAGMFLASVLFVAVLTVGLFYVWTRMQLVEIGYEISNLENRNRDLKKRSSELALEIASLESPAELERKASRMGLILPPVGRVVHVP